MAAAAAPSSSAAHSEKCNDVWEAAEHVVTSGNTCLFLGTRDHSPPTSPKGRKKKSPSTITEAPVLARARISNLAQISSSGDTPDEHIFYFEVFIKTTGGGLSPSGSVGVGLTSELEPEFNAFDPGCFLHYHSSRGARFSAFPRTAGRSTNCGPSFGVGDTIGCGWLSDGSVFFTCVPPS